MRISDKLVLASTNIDKFLEFKSLFKTYPEVTLVPANELIRNADKLKFVEKYSTYSENAKAKARVTNHAAHYASLADDSGLEVAALGGKPGVHSHRYAIPKTGVTQDEANIQKLLEELENIPADKRQARFVASLALVMEGILLSGEGVLEGTLVNSPRGGNGFGYDPIFVPQGSDKTLAEMTDEEKNAISHRSRALQALMAQVKARGIIFAKP